MKKLIYFLLALPLVFAACKPEPAPEPGPDNPTPEVLTFEVEVGEVTHSVVNFTITPSDVEAEYLCVLYDAETVEEFTRDEFLVQTLYQELETEARQTGKTLEEYMPEIVDKGVLESKYERLAPETEYYIVVFGVDAANKYEANTAVNKTKVATLAAPKVDITFEIKTTVDGNTAQYEVTPSDNETIWYFYTLPKASFDYYTGAEPDGLGMTDVEFILYCLQMQIEQLRGAGYTDNQILNAIFHKGALTLEAKDLEANTEYINLIAAFDITEAGEISIISDVTTTTYTTGEAKAKDLSFEISVTDVEAMRAAIKITPSNDTDTFCWLVGQWDTVQTAEEVMNGIVASYGAWMSMMANYKGVQDFTGGAGSPYKYRLDAADTDYYVIAFGYAGGITTEPVMVTFKTLPAPAAEDTTFEMTASNITPYSFEVAVTPSETTTYWTLDMCLPEDFNEEAIIEAFNTGIDEMIAAYKEFDPNTTIAQILGTSFYRGTYSNIGATGLTPETAYMGYVMAIDPETGHVAKLHKFEDLATTLAVGSVTPAIELVGYYSGDEENGSVFGQPEATKGKAITVVKYTNLDGARSLFSTMLRDDMTNTATYSDSYIWGAATQYWQSVKTAQPYSFYVADWDYAQTALAYAVDNNGLPGGIGRLYTMPTAENKGDVADLKALVDELNAAAQQSFVIPEPFVYNGNQGITISHVEINNDIVVAQPAAKAEVKMETPALNPNEVVVGGGYIRPFYL